MKHTKLIAGAMSALMLSSGIIFSSASYADYSIWDKSIVERERTPEEKADIEALAKMLWGEARGIKSMTEQAACVWVVLNRVDDSRWPDNAVDVLSQKYQFGGYSAKNPVDENLKKLAEDVYDRWLDEKAGKTDVGRCVPEDYYFWRGSRDCKHNWFRKTFNGYYEETYIFDLESPYDD